jgi:hypothetical protein
MSPKTKADQLSGETAGVEDQLVIFSEDALKDQEAAQWIYEHLTE